MFRVQPYLENTQYTQFNLENAIVLPGNGAFQEKNRYKFNIIDRDNFYDWYNAYFRVDFKFEAKANGANIVADTESAPINGSFSLIKSLRVKSSGKELYYAGNIHKIIFIKNLLDFSVDYSRSVAKNQFWYLDNDATTATDANATNLGMRARALLSHGGQIVQTMIPLNRFSFFESLSDRLLPPMQLEFDIELQNDKELIYQNDGTERRIVVRKFELWVPQLHFTGKGQTLVNENFLKPTQWKYLKENMYYLGERRDANSMFMIGSQHKNPKHVFIFFQEARKTDDYTQNPYFFDTFDLDGDDSAKLSNCRLQCGTNFYPQVDYDYDFKLRILNDLMNFRYRKNDYNSGVQLQVANFEKLYPIIYFYLRNVKETLTGDPQTLYFHYRLNEAANAHDYKLFAAVLTEEEFIVKPLGNELVVV